MKLARIFKIKYLDLEVLNYVELSLPQNFEL